MSSRQRRVRGVLEDVLRDEYGTYIGVYAIEVAVAAVLSAVEAADAEDGEKAASRATVSKTHGGGG